MASAGSAATILSLSAAAGGKRLQSVIDFISTSGFGLTAFQMFFFAGFAFVAALAFGLVARTYPVEDHYRKA